MRLNFEPISLPEVPVDPLPEETLVPEEEILVIDVESDYPNYVAESAVIRNKGNINRLLARPEVQIEGTNAADTLRGDLTKTNAISGRNGNDLVTGGNNGDILSGDRGDDRVDGGAGLDFVYGGVGKDQLKGGAGDDYLQGDGGDDRLIGGAGIDQFAIQKNKGRDTIVDYKDGEDKLATFNVTFEQIKLVQQGANTLIQSNGSAIALLKNVQASTLTAEDFVIPLPIVV